MSELEKYFSKFRKNIIGIDESFNTPFGKKKIIYADWIASGRLYKPIEEKICETFGPLVGNTHSEASVTGTTMTLAYHQAHKIIKEHVNADKDDVIITAGSGMTTVICKFQRLLGLKIPEQLVDYINLSDELKPVVFITHMEHHSNQTTWLETIADVIVIDPNNDGLVDIEDFKKKLKKYKDRKLIIGAFTAASNVTGIEPDYYELAKITHQHGGYCFVDFACAAPYVKIDMHPNDPEAKLDAIFFSPHKFLGGPGSAGVLIFNRQLYKNETPDTPGGGTVKWTNRWGGYSYISDIEVKEDGGTPGFLQGIKAALAVRLKERMGTEKIHLREKELIEIAFRELADVKGLHILADNINERLGVFSFYIDNIHHNLVTRLLNDRFGIQVRGGCSCAGTYGHFLLRVDFSLSKEITDRIEAGDLSMKPGWIRLSLHPTMTDEELLFISESIKEVAEKGQEWAVDYVYDSHTNEYHHITELNSDHQKYSFWFETD